MDLNRGIEQFYINENKSYKMRPISESDGMIYQYWRDGATEVEISEEEMN